MMNTTTLDTAGRIVIPKSLRDALRLAPGDTIELSEDDGEITLRPVRSTAFLVKEMGVWVYRSGTPAVGVESVIEQSREERLEALAR